MDDRYIDIIKMMWDEMNPIEGYSSPEANNSVNKIRSQFGLPRKGALYKNNINNIINIDRTKIKLPWLTKANIPRVYESELTTLGGKPYQQAYVVPEEEIKYIKNNFDMIKNRIPIKSMGKMVNKILNEPVVKLTGKVANKSIVPLSILEGIGLNQPAY